MPCISGHCFYSSLYIKLTALWFHSLEVMVQLGQFSQLLIVTISILLAAPSAKAQQPYGHLPADEIKFITIDGKQTEVLVRSWQSKKHFGSAMIIAASDTDADAAGLASYLRTNINARGWASISLTPAKGLYRPNYATKPEEVTKAGTEQLQLTSNKSTPKYESSQLLELRNFQQSNLNEALNQLTSTTSLFPGGKILIVIDDTAGMVTNLLYDKKIPTPDVLVIVNAYREFEYLIDPQSQRKSIAEQLVTMSIPILDIQSADAHPNSIEQAPTRLNYNQVKPAKYYRQYQMSLDLSSPSGWEEALDQIEGFSRTVIGR
ncbi:alpha/beta hydrolase family protein [Shewanella frigidimarina]|uniref:alpha/beta hydrolase family protein n=1 Tax=Shewanella frigidimarina TaxID=56812 RepID=UPI003FA1507A